MCPHYIMPVYDFNKESLCVDGQEDELPVFEHTEYITDSFSSNTSIQRWMFLRDGHFGCLRGDFRCLYTCHTSPLLSTNSPPHILSPAAYRGRLIQQPGVTGGQRWNSLTQSSADSHGDIGDQRKGRGEGGWAGTKLIAVIKGTRDISTR